MNSPGTKPSPATCPSCGTETPSLFCDNCGEKKISAYDLSVRHYLEEAFSAVTSLDSKVLRTVWLLVSRPGYLSSEYFRGSRVRYVKPLQLFLLFNVIYYFSLTLLPATTFTTPLDTQLHMNNYYPSYAKARVEQVVQQKRTSYQEFEIRYNQEAGVLSKTLIFLLIPLFALLFFALFFRKRHFLVEHVVASTHFWAFNLLLLGIFLPAATTVASRLLRALHISPEYLTNDAVLSAVVQVSLGIYLFLMLRRFYAASQWYCAVATAAIAWSFFHVLWLYRFFLFEVTLRIV